MKKKFICLGAFLFLVLCLFQVTRLVDQLLDSQIQLQKSKLSVIKNLKYEKVYVTYFFPKIIVKNIDFQDRGLKLKAKKLKLTPSWLSLFSGKLYLSNVQIVGLETDLTKMKSSKSKTSNQFVLSEFLEIIPFKKLSIYDSKVSFKSLDFKVVDVRLNLSPKHILIESNELRVSSQEPEFVRDYKLTGDFSYKLGQLFVKQFKFGDDSFKLHIDGKIRAPLDHLTREDHWRSADVLFKIENHRNFPPLLFKVLNLDESLSGSINTVVKLNKKNNNLKLEVVHTQSELKLKSDIIPKVKIYLAGDRKDVVIKSLSVDSEFLSLSSQKMILTHNNLKNLTLKRSKLYVKKLKLEGGLKRHLNSSAPLPTEIQGELECLGEILSVLKLKCYVLFDVERFDVKEQNQEALLSFKPFQLGGDVVFTSQGLSLDAFAKSRDGESRGWAQGKVDFKKGYNIDFEATPLNTKDFNTFFGLDIKGDFNMVQGKSSGNLGGATLESNLVSDDFWVFGYGLGKINSSFAYENRKVLLNTAQGQINKTKYKGGFQYYIRDSSFKTDLDFKPFRAQDLLYALKNKVQLPVHFEGVGIAKIKASGPFDLSGMNYNISTKIKTGLIHKENFTDLKMNIDAQKGHAKLTNGQFHLGKYPVYFDGKSDNQGMIEGQILADKIDLKNLNSFQDFGFRPDGFAKMSFKLTDFILAPLSVGRVQISKFATNNQIYPKSEFDLRLRSDHAVVDGSFFGDQVKGKIHIPYSQEGPFFSDLKFDNFSFVYLFDFFDSNFKTLNPVYKLSAELKTLEPIRSFKNSLANIDIQEVELGYERHKYTLRKPTTLKMRGGHVTGLLELQDINQDLLKISFDNKEVLADGVLKLQPLAPLVPGVGSLRGEINGNFKFNLSNIKKSSGMGRLRGLSFDIPGMRQRFSNMQGQLRLDKGRMQIKDIEGDWAEGRILAQSSLVLGVPLKFDFKGKFTDIDLEYPKDVFTQGSGTFDMKAHGLPIVLGGNYQLTGGSFKMDLYNPDGVTAEVPSPFSPQMTKESSPIHFNIGLELPPSFKVDTPDFKGEVTGGLKITGDLSEPLFTGKILTLPDFIYRFREHEFNVEKANLVYNESLVDQPIIDAVASSEVTDNNEIVNTNYLVRVLVEGPVKDPSLSLSSEPVLDEQSIVSLLAFGTKISNNIDQQISTSNQQSQTGLSIGSVLLDNKLTRGLQDQLGVSLQISSAFDNQDVNPKVTLKKSWSPRISTSASQSFGVNRKSSGVLEYKFSRNFSLLGTYENLQLEDASLLRTRNPDQSNILGLDVQYNLQFE